ncbi:MAG: hypothetical protein MRY83_22855 [Flavobacteriales bacterium]|nr:hypothetical protein [Flavobacteriales bacterium]
MMIHNNKISLREKEVIRLRKELNKLYWAKRHLGEYELEKPIRHGWYKFLVLREDISRRKDAKIFQNILDVAGMRVWGRDKKHLDKVWEKRARDSRYVSQLGIYKLDKKHFGNLMHKAREYFQGYERTWTYWRGSDMVYYCRVPSYYYITKYERAYITHRKIHDADLERRIAEIESLMDRDEYYDISNMYYLSYSYKWLKKYTNKRTRRHIQAALTQFDPSFDEEIDIDWVLDKSNKKWW